MKKSRITDVSAFMSEARERFSQAMQIDKTDRDIASENARFASGDQWDEDVKQARMKLHRPVLTWNRIPTFTAQVTNDGRQSKPAIRVSAMDGGTKQTAEFFQGRIRHIEYETDADIAYDTAREGQINSGRGFYRVSLRYKPRSLKQEIRIEPIENQFSVVFGPHREYDCSDADYCFVLSPAMTQDEFKRKYGADAEVVKANFFEDRENPATDWIGVGPRGDMVQVAEYWVKEYYDRTVVRLDSGVEAYKDELPEEALSTVKEERVESCCEVWQYIIDGVEIHDETEWIGEETGIPIIPQWGRQEMVDGVRRNHSLIENAVDPQRLVNLYVSNIAEQIGQLPKNPFRAPAGAIAGFEEIWAKINTDPMAVVPYNQFDENGRELRPPEREVAEPPIQALTIGLGQAIDAIKASMGIFDSSLGARSNETSGIAIQRRQKESDNANFHFHDNEGRSRRRLGRILLELIPKVDTSGMVATRSEDGKTKRVFVNQPGRDPDTGEIYHHDLTKGDYSCAISTGPSYTSQRQEAFDTYSQIANADKQFMQVAGDLLFRNLDAPGSDQIADRYEKILPPQLQPQKAGQAQQQVPPQVQAQMQMLMQQHGQLLNEVQILTQDIKNRVQEKQLELQSRERMVAMQEETKRLIAISNLNSKEGLSLLESELEAIRQKADQQHDLNMLMTEHQQTQQLAEQQQQADQQQQQQRQQADAQQAQQDRMHQAGMQRADQLHQALLAANQQPSDDGQMPQAA